MESEGNMPVWTMETKGRQYQIEVSSPEFICFTDKNTRRLALFIKRQTQYPNIVWVRMITIGYRWPWFRNKALFHDISEPEETG